jgi:hypothetical protein
LAATYASAAEVCDPDGDGHCTLHDVAAALAVGGVDPIALSVEDESLPRLPCIIHLRRDEHSDDAGGHFVYVEPISDDLWRVYSPPVGIFEWRSKTVLARSSRRLVASRSDWSTLASSRSSPTLWFGVALFAGALFFGAALYRQSRRRGGPAT